MERGEYSKKFKELFEKAPEEPNLLQKIDEIDGNETIPYHEKLSKISELIKNFLASILSN